MTRLSIWNRLAWATMAICGTVFTGIGLIADVTIWIPHARHGHAPTTLGYIAAYTATVWVLLALVPAVGFAYWAALTDD